MKSTVIKVLCKSRIMYSSNQMQNKLLKLLAQSSLRDY